MGLARLPFLARLAVRYARRHRGQTVRALLGLLVSTTVLTVGLGLGESVGTSIAEAALARFGDIDVVLVSGEPFETAEVDRLLRDPRVAAQGLRGAVTLSFVGSASHPAEKLADSFTAVRGVVPGERAAFGPLRGPDGRVVAEPRSGEVVISTTLADVLKAEVGDRIVLLTPSPGAFSDLRFVTVNYTGVAGAPGPLPPVGGVGAPSTLEVGEDALGLAAFAVYPPQAGATVTIEARAPSGVAFANRSTSPPTFLIVEPPLEPGTWTIRVTANSPVVYNGTAGVAYPPASLTSGAVRLEATVSGIAVPESRAGLSGRPTALVPLDDLQAAAGLRGRVNTVAWSVDGNADDAASVIRSALPEALADARVSAVKEDAIRQSARATENMTGFLLVMSGFTLLAGMLLAFALFSALVEERRGELGIARALGLSRGEVALAMTLEGALYAGAAALVGLLLGLGLLAGFLRVLTGFVVAEGGPPVGFHVSPLTMTIAFLVGTLLPLATIGFASLRFARLDPSRAIRGIPEDPSQRRRTGWVVAAVLGAAGLLLSITPLGRLLGAPIALAGAALALAVAGQRVLAVLVVAATAAQVAWSLYTYNDFPEGLGELDPILTLARGVVLALILAALAVASAGPYVGFLRLVGRLGQAPRSAFVAVKYLVARRGAAGLTAAMIALVVVVVTVMGTLMLLFGAQIPQEEAGYQVLGESALRLDDFPSPLPADLARAIERVDPVYRHFELRSTNFTIDGEPVGPENGIRSFLGVTADFAAANRYPLIERAAQYPSDRAAWDAVVRGEAVIVPTWYPNDEFGPGDRVTLVTVLGGEKEYVVAATVRTDYVFGAFLGADDVRAMGFPTGSYLYVRLVPGADPDTVAHRLTAEYGEGGVTFTSIPEEAARIATLAQAAVLVFESFLSLGLFVGLAGTGFLAARAVHERARDIGTLRALGFEEADIRRAFVLESVVTAGIGLAVGIGVGVLVAHSVWWREIRADGYPFVLPWLILGVFTAAVLALAAFAAWRPARRAARLPPALAVRHSE